MREEEVAPPWQRFPTYPRFTIGWRMGEGEDWLIRWGRFVCEWSR
jgi:hypothetical protein